MPLLPIWALDNLPLMLGIGSVSVKRITMYHVSGKTSKHTARLLNLRMTFESGVDTFALKHFAG